MRRGDRRNSEIFRRKVRELLAAGKTVAQIMKATGKTHAYVSMIVAQEQAEMPAAQQPVMP